MKGKRLNRANLKHVTGHLKTKFYAALRHHSDCKDAVILQAVKFSKLQV